MPSLSRRDFTQQALGLVLPVAFLQTLARHDLFAQDRRPAVIAWLNRVNQLGFDLKERKLTQGEWQKLVEELYAKADVAGFLELLDFDRLTQNIELVDNGARSLQFKFPEVEGVPRNLAWGKQIFLLKPGRSVVPHGHNNMSTAFLILQGEFRGRHYDRVRDEAEHFILKPTIDKTFKPGDCSTVSDQRDNVHWFQSTSRETAVIFNIHVTGVNPQNTDPTGRLYVDPRGEKVADGEFRCRRIDYEEAHKLYG
ncbi:MAG: hypothetical protein ACK5HA_18005 [Planctomycetaceae bacterium]|jgi:hypothetical protein